MITLILFLAALTAEPVERPPNIVFILADDLGWTDVHSGFYETPHIDELARRGMVFTDAYANAPNCAPTRACLMSGQYSPRHGVYTVNSSERGPLQMRKIIPVPNTKTLHEKAVTIAEALKPAGYVCASIGKWHLGDDPVDQGFDVNIGGSHYGHPPAGYFAPYEMKNLDEAPEGEYLTDRLTDEALQFMEENRDKPFFLYLPHYAVHTPLQGKKEIVAKYEEKEPVGGHDEPRFAAMVESLDEGVGKVLEKLEELDLTHCTMVIFFSDNGGVLNITSNAPLRGGKGMLYEGGIRVPLIVSWPGKVKPGTTCSEPVIGVDFYPTLLDMAGAEVPPDHVLDGVSLKPLLTREGGLDREALYWHFPAYLEGGRAVKGPWRTTPAGAVRQGEWKLIEFFEDRRLELYHLAGDVGEREDLASRKPRKVEALHRLLNVWRESVDAPVPRELNPKYDPHMKKDKK